MLILDTYVISEVMKSQPLEHILTWLNTQDRNELYTTVISQAELFYGMEILPDGARKNLYAKTLKIMFKTVFKGRILDFTQEDSLTYSQIASSRKKIGKPISQFDAQIAAIAKTHQATLVTRNIKDFLHCDITLFNPWETSSP